MKIGAGQNVCGALAAIAAVLVLTWGGSAQAYNDAPDSSAVSTAHLLIDGTNVDPESGRVRKGNEAEYLNLAQKMDAGRKTGGATAMPADAYFLETLVCLHHAAQGALYTGLIRVEETEACCGCSGQRNRSR